jgi:dTDP-4-dehydrorhamnose reductase
MINILVTGANGQLGSEIKKISPRYSDMQFIYTDVDNLDICNYNDIENFFDTHKVDYIINCAAYTAVDKAESDKETAYKVNVEAVKNLSKITNKCNSNLVHISTDYVFGSSKQNVPFKETDNTSPNSVYGITKLEGEEAAKKADRHIIIRTSWLYSSFGNNFLKTILRHGKEKEELRVLFDQVGTPCYAADLADAILKIIDISEKSKEFATGMYHYSNEGVCSWYDFAYQIIKISNLKCRITPIETKDYPLPANRPPYSVMNKAKIKEVFKLEIPHWTDGLERCFKEL